MQTSSVLRALTVAGLSIAFALPALAQPPSNSAIGEVLTTEGPEGSVVVARGSGVYALAKGDTLFAGDRIFTRSNATAKLRANGCERDLPNGSSIELGDEFCRVAIASLGGPVVVEALPALTAGVGTAAQVSSTPGVLALLAGGGAAAAAVASSAAESAHSGP